MSEQLQLNIQEVYLGDPPNPNPMIQLHGPGPAGCTCGGCASLRGWGRSRTFWKCRRRGDLTHGKATDQLKRWSACGLYEVRV